MFLALNNPGRCIKQCSPTAPTLVTIPLNRPWPRASSAMRMLFDATIVTMVRRIHLQGLSCNTIADRAAAIVPAASFAT